VLLMLLASARYCSSPATTVGVVLSSAPVSRSRLRLFRVGKVWRRSRCRPPVPGPASTSGWRWTSWPPSHGRGRRRTEGDYEEE